jgi:signal transduction histidine kinase
MNRSMPPVETATLELVKGVARHQRWRLGPESCRIGRVEDNEVCLEDRAVSRYHARIEYADGDFFIQDAGSSSGVFVGGQRVERSALRDGSLIRLGDSVLRFARTAAPAEVSGSGGVLLEVLETINAAPDLDQVEEHVLDAVMRLTGAERGFLLLAPAPGQAGGSGPGGLEVRLARPPGSAATAVSALSSTILERAIDSGALVAFEDASEDEAMGTARSVVSQRLRAVVCAPLRAGRQAGEPGGPLLGALYADNPSRSAAFDHERLEAVRALARHAAFAIRNAQLIEQGQRTIQELQLARDQAREASRAKAAFLATMSHELHTPLNAILGYAEMLEEHLAERGDDAGLADLGRIRQSGRRLLHLIDDVLSLSELESEGSTLRVSPIDLDALFEQVADEAREAVAARGNRLELRLAKPLGSLRGDERRIRQVLWKLLSNAAKFTEAGRVTLAARRDGELLEFRVEDTGIGMAPDQTRLVFEPFTQLDGGSTRRYEGGGLGLAVAHRICRAMSAEISVESEPGRGSCFQVRVPPARAAVPAQPSAPATAPAPKAANRNPTDSST